MNKQMLIVLLIAVASIACNRKPTPRPYAYFRIHFPEHKYQNYISDTCPMTFEYSQYAIITREGVRENNPCWFNIVYPRHKAFIHITLRRVNKNLDSLMDDSYTLIYKHTTKADAIEARDFTNKDKNIFATFFTLRGNAASNMQFHITDTTKYFLRGSLYFNHTPNYDSLLPVIEYISKDIEHLVESFQWTKTKCNECF